MKCNEKQIAHLDKSTFVDCAIISNNYMSILMVYTDGGDILEGTPPTSMLLIPFKGNECRGAVWDANKWVFPMQLSWMQGMTGY